LSHIPDLDRLLISDQLKLEKELSYGKYKVVGKGPKLTFSMNDVCLCICSCLAVSKRLHFFIIGHLSFRWVVGWDSILHFSSRYRWLFYKVSNSHDNYHQPVRRKHFYRFPFRSFYLVPWK